MPIHYYVSKSKKRTLVRALLTPMERRAYNSWIAMRNRCKRTDEAFADLASYHAKGIKVCDEWRNDFEQFVKDMGPPPTPKHSLDRKENSKGYNADNCRWATAREQALNRNQTIFITIGGRKEPLSIWAEISGIKSATIRQRHLSGRPEHELLSREELPKRSGRMITINGRRQNVAAWAAEIGVSAPCIFYRLKLGMKGAELFNTPTPRPRLAKGGRPFGSKNKPRVLFAAELDPQVNPPTENSPLTDGAPAPH